MANLKINFAGSAINDLEDIIKYYSEQQAPRIGRDLVKKIISDIELLISQPEMGRIVPEFEQPFLRELIRPPFRIVYRLGRLEISIIRIWRSER